MTETKMYCDECKKEILNCEYMLLELRMLGSGASQTKKCELCYSCHNKLIDAIKAVNKSLLNYVG